ncbi:MAG: amidohydrolase [Deltaproteobacteria bacterium HGW-Deltaproteobacteria-14]|jgi:N-acyl-D-aspartate/D-glutamate deacylase|nr:MAG: amidohydrolase [Deltaproteobacteria bacterium HGW-Deltaproteobacteria-14]
MGYDLKIIGGTVVDGTGAPARRADVAVADGRIVAVGECAGGAARTIDADGALVTPGFVDIHTHYDGQISWDDELAPSCFHGVTTAVIGNCGVGFAPCRATDRDRLVDLMQGVEDIPGTALSEGITWDWESFPEFLDAIDSRPHTIDFGAYIPHDALRVYVMGDRAVADEQANDADIATMRRHVREALEAGAVGLATGRSDNHRAADGSFTPASESSVRELTGLASALDGLGHGVLQAVSDFDIRRGKAGFDAEFDVLEAMMRAAPGHGLSLSLLQRVKDTAQWKRVIQRAEGAVAKGLDMRLQVGARGIGVLLGLEATFQPFMGFPSYKSIAHLSRAERVAAMRDPAFKARLLSEKSDRVAGDGSNIPALADDFLQNLDFVAMRLWRLGEDFSYEPDSRDSVLAQALARKVSPLEVIYEAMLEDDGRELLYFPIYNYIGMNLDVVHTMLTHPLALSGLSDGGAHVGTICDASFPTYMLTHWARDRHRGPQLGLEQVVEMLTRRNAAWVGMRDRGIVAPGMKADLNVIDFDRLRLRRPRLVADLPAGGKRLLQDAEGYRATIVSGEVITVDGQLTQGRPGRLVRVGRA